MFSVVNLSTQQIVSHEMFAIYNFLITLYFISEVEIQSNKKKQNKAK